MIKTLGLTHIALPVKNIKRSSQFYQKVFGVKEMYCQDDFIQVQTPGAKDIIVFEQRRPAKKLKPAFHFSFRLPKPAGLKKLIKTIEDAGGKIRQSGEFIPGEPYVFFYDPDGYELEVWFEKIPPSLKSFK